MSRLPNPGGDENTWGVILNDFLSQAHAADGSLKVASIAATHIADGAVGAGKLAADAVTTVSVANDAITEPKLAVSNAPTSGYVLSWNGTALAWVAAATGDPAVGGDLTGTASNAQIAAGAIVNADINAAAAIAQSKIANLTTDLAGKAATSHTHVIADTTGLQTALDGKAATGHAHVIADVTGLQTTLDAKAATSHVHAAGDITSGVLAAARIPADIPQTLNAQTGTTYTVVIADAGRVVTFNNASPITLTLPQDSDAAISIGSRIDCIVLGTGMVTFAAGAGATVNATPSLVTRAQYSAATAIKYAANSWIIVGDLA